MQKSYSHQTTELQTTTSRMDKAPVTPLCPTHSATFTPTLRTQIQHQTHPFTRRGAPAEVRSTVQRINPRKAAGPNNIPGRVLRGCAHQGPHVQRVRTHKKVAHTLFHVNDQMYQERNDRGNVQCLTPTPGLSYALFCCC